MSDVFLQAGLGETAAFSAQGGQTGCARKAEMSQKANRATLELGLATAALATAAGVSAAFGAAPLAVALGAGALLTGLLGGGMAVLANVISNQAC